MTPQTVYRPFVTFPNGHQCFVAAIVRNDAEKQAVLNQVGAVTQNMLGTLAHSLPPPRIRELAAKVEFFRVAQG